MQQGLVRRNLPIVTMLAAVFLVIAVFFTLALPLTSCARAAERPAAQASTPDRATNIAARKSDVAKSDSADRSETAESHEISALIHQLGDPAYSVRQRATKRLIDLGIETQALLIQALDDDDAEVRSRAGQVLAQVKEADFHLRLEAFANDLEGRQQHTLPCWGRFSQRYGQDKVSRMLFVEMQKAEPALLEALDTNPKLASELFVMRMQSILQSLPLPLRDVSGEPSIKLGTICSLLTVSAAEGVTVSDQDALQLGSLILQSFQRNFSGHVAFGISKKMLGAWIVHNSNSALVRQSFVLAFTFDLKEGLDLAQKLLANEGSGQLPAVRHDALLAIGRFGNHEHIALVEPLLKDSSFCLPLQANDARQPQVRDIALAVLVHLSGQEPKDYGLDQGQLNFQTLSQPGAITFADPLTRDAALHQWERWAGRGSAGRADNPGAGKEAGSQSADGKPTATAPAAATPPATAIEPAAPAAKGNPPAAPRPAELVP